MAQSGKIKIQKVDPWRWRIPREGKMRTDGLVYASEEMLRDIEKDQSLVQVANVATLPGIVGRSMAMPDIHWGYGFPIGGVAAFDVDDGVVSPGGVGYDIN
jgi:tRNA-splicing ligase RtcB